MFLSVLVSSQYMNADDGQGVFTIPIDLSLNHIGIKSAQMAGRCAVARNVLLKSRKMRRSRIMTK